MMQPTTDPTQDPEVRRRLMQKLAQPTADPTAPATAPVATPSPTFTQPSQNTGIAGAGSLTTATPSFATPQGATRTGTNNFTAPTQPDGPTTPATPAPVTPAPATPAAPTFNEAELERLWLEKAASYPGAGINGQSVMEFLADNPQISAGVNLAGSNSTKLRLPDGRIADLVYSSNDPTHAHPQWIIADSGGGSPGAGTPMPAANNPWLDDIRAQLRARMATDQSPVDENAPQIAQALGAARLEQSRSMDTERKALAERLYAQGGGDVSGNELSQGIQQSAERNATGMSQLRANLIMNEYQARRADLNDAMQQALASGDAQMAREVQMALAQLDAQLRREGYGVSMAQFAQSQNTNTVNHASGN